MTGYTIAVVPQLSGKVLLRFQGPLGFRLSFEMLPAEARKLADDITTIAERERRNPDSGADEQKGHSIER